ncbi:MAG: peptidase and chymotrypsin/Hap [Microbacteriaceae bacterium]|jgi:putative serine protease PepD|nr:peptidase and chymotrypsin/Hap [Microbacteriaceae bacterium]
MKLGAEPHEDEVRRGPGRWSRVIAFAGLAVLVVVAVLLAVLVARPGGATTADSLPTATPTPTPTAPTVSDVFQHVGPSVVVIQTDTALGTGVVAADDGTILTANHVIAGAKTISVTFSDGSTTSATVASSDAMKDIATLTPASLPQILVPATLGGTAAVGAAVIAIGNPLGLTYSESSGIVAGLNRAADTANGEYAGLIQFDASVNPGSSGGPLLDASGNVIGIVVSIADPGNDDAWAGIGFAVPISDALGDTGAGRKPQI